MHTGLYLQYAVIGVLVLASLIVTIRKVAPAPSARLLGTLAGNLDRPNRGSALQALGRWLRPAQATGDCGDGCSTCGSCDTPDPKAAAGASPGTNEQPLTFHAPSPRRDA